MKQKFNMFNQDNKFKEEQSSLLEYKDHNEFFTKFYEFRTLVIFNMSNQQLKYSIEGMKELFISINNLVEWTSEYINIDDITKEIEIIDVLINKIDKVKPELLNEYLDNIFKKLKLIFRRISKQHSNNELLPKVHTNEEEEDPFKDETQHYKKLMYKVVVKMFENV